MPPLWKIRRELLRLFYAPFRGTVEFVRMLYVRRYYDSVLSRQVKRHSGTLPLSQEIGVYLIFPSHGVLPSHLRMLREMKAAGIAPFVVSNLPLSEENRAQLAPLAAFILERPNVGYDFGGYRDAVLELVDQLPDLKRLWLLNDSTWLIPQPTSWFEDARALNVDFAAATSNFATPRVDPDRFRDIDWAFSVDHKNFHYASYALGIGSKILRDSDFLTYWQKLEIRNDKSRTVRRGEIGLSKWVLAKGYSHRATCEVDRLDIELAVLDDVEIDCIAHDLIIPENPWLESQKTRILQSNPNSPNGRDDRIALILMAVSRHACGYVLPGYTLRRRGFQFLKKSPLKQSSQTVQSMHRLISRLDEEIGAEISSEAEMISSVRTHHAELVT